MDCCLPLHIRGICATVAVLALQSKRRPFSRTLTHVAQRSPIQGLYRHRQTGQILELLHIAPYSSHTEWMAGLGVLLEQPSRSPSSAAQLLQPPDASPFGQALVSRLALDPSEEAIRSSRPTRSRAGRLVSLQRLVI